MHFLTQSHGILLVLLAFVVIGKLALILLVDQRTLRVQGLLSLVNMLLGDLVLSH